MIGRRLLGALGWLCLTLAAICVLFLAMTVVLPPNSAPALRTVAALGLVASALGPVGLALLQRTTKATTESAPAPSMTQWLPAAFLAGLIFGTLIAIYFIVIQAPLVQALWVGLMAGIVVFSASCLGFSRPPKALP